MNLPATSRSLNSTLKSTTASTAPTTPEIDVQAKVIPLSQSTINPLTTIASTVSDNLPTTINQLLIEYLKNSTQTLTFSIKDRSKSTTPTSRRDLFQIVNFKDNVTPKASKGIKTQSVNNDGANFTTDGVLIPSLEQTLVMTQPTVSNTAKAEQGVKALRDEVTRSAANSPPRQSTTAGPSTALLKDTSSAKDDSLPRTVQQLTSDVEGIKHQMEHGGFVCKKAGFLLCLFCL